MDREPTVTKGELMSRMSKFLSLVDDIPEENRIAASCICSFLFEGWWQYWANHEHEEYNRGFRAGTKKAYLIDVLPMNKQTKKVCVELQTALYHFYEIIKYMDYDESSNSSLSRSVTNVRDYLKQGMAICNDLLKMLVRDG